MDTDLENGCCTAQIILPTIFSHPSFALPDQDYIQWVLVGLDLDVPQTILKEMKKVAEEKCQYAGFQVVTQVITEWIKERTRKGEKPLVNDLVKALKANRLESFGDAIQAAFETSAAEKGLETDGGILESKTEDQPRQEMQQQENQASQVAPIPDPEYFSSSEEKRRRRDDDPDPFYNPKDPRQRKYRQRSYNDDRYDGNDFDKDGLTSFHRYVKANKMDSVLHLIQYKTATVDINETTNDSRKNTALHLTAWNIPERNAAIDMIKTLIRHGADVDKLNAKKASFIDGLFNPEVAHIPPINSSQFHELVTFLLNLGHKNVLLTPSGISGDIVFHRAMRKSIMGLDTIKFLHFNGIGLSFLSPQGNGLLYYSVMGGRDLEIIKCLIQFGANWKNVNNDGCNLLHICAQYKNLKAFEYFIEMKPELARVKNKDRLTPFHTLKKSHPEEKEILKEVRGLVWKSSLAKI